jgi:hypothetical protein
VRTLVFAAFALTGGRVLADDHPAPMTRDFQLRGRFVDGGRTTRLSCHGKAIFEAAPDVAPGCWRWHPAGASCTGDPNADPLADDAEARVACQEAPARWRVKTPAFFFAGECAITGGLDRMDIRCSWRCRDASCEGQATYTFFRH